MSATLGLFAKWPGAGHVKTRLASATSPDWAADVANAFLRDAVQRFAGVDARRVLVFAPRDASDLFGTVAGSAFELRPQADGDLGQRLADFLGAALAEGADRVVVVGTDSPTLPVAFVRAALDHLRHADVVLGPATDGGYYLIGCRHRLPPLFDGIAWSTADVTAATVACAQAAGLSLALLPPWYDVDTLDDWRMLGGHLQAMRCAGIDPEVPHTEKLAVVSNQPWDL
jgi:rSAM/selenodomain-associated transferase 1